jgi:hypothetical protein
MNAACEHVSAWHFKALARVAVRANGRAPGWQAVLVAARAGIGRRYTTGDPD